MKVITVSREFGSGGRELGKRLSDELNFAYYDDELITAIADKVKLDKGYVNSVIEKGLHTSFPFTFARSFYYPTVFNQNDMDILWAQQEILKELAQKTDCIIVGRCSNIILEEYRPLNLFVYASLGAKMKRCRLRAREDENLTDNELKKKMKQIDSDRAKQQMFLSDLKWGDKESYDLCINTTNLDIKKLTRVIGEYARFWFEEKH